MAIDSQFVAFYTLYQTQAISPNIILLVDLVLLEKIDGPSSSEIEVISTRKQLCKGCAESGNTRYSVCGVAYVCITQIVLNAMSTKFSYRHQRQIHGLVEDKKMSEMVIACQFLDKYSL